MIPWIVTFDALALFEQSPPVRDQPVASYFQDTKPKPTYDISFQADIAVEGKPESTTVCETVNGCNINTGDFLATGTISGSTKESHGCLWELTEGGEIPFDLEGGGKRAYLEDGGFIRITGVAGDGAGFGDCIGTILPARRKDPEAEWIT